MVSPEERDCYFYTKSIRALSELSFERLPAMCWTLLKISGNPVFKTPGRYIYIFWVYITVNIVAIVIFTKFWVHVQNVFNIRCKRR